MTPVVAHVTLFVPEDLQRRMKAHPEVNWSEVIRRLIAREIHGLERMEAIARRSTLSPDDIDELDHRIKEGLRSRYDRMRPRRIRRAPPRRSNH